MYSTVNRHRVGFAATSGSGTGVSDAAPAGKPSPRRALNFSTVASAPVVIPSLTHVSLLSSPPYTNFRGVGVSSIIDKESG